MLFKAISQLQHSKVNIRFHAKGNDVAHLQHSKVNIRFHAKGNDLAQGCPNFSDAGSTFAKICSN